MPELTIEERLAIIEGAVLEIAAHPAVYNFGWICPNVKALIAAVEARTKPVTK
jgi:hypothetical protein